MNAKTGLIHAYYGDGKGKTTAAFGLAFRCAGYGRQVVITQFFKSRDSGEITAAEQFPQMTILRGHPLNKFTFQMNADEKEQLKDDCLALWNSAIETAIEKQADLLILDECLDACAHGYLSEALVADFLDHRPAHLEIVFTGHSLPPEIEARAHYISKVVKERHPYDEGISGRQTIEY